MLSTWGLVALSFLMDYKPIGSNILFLTIQPPSLPNSPQCMISLLTMNNTCDLFTRNSKYISGGFAWRALTIHVCEIYEIEIKSELKYVILRIAYSCLLMVWNFLDRFFLFSLEYFKNFVDVQLLSCVQGLRHGRLPSPSLSLGVCSDSCQRSCVTQWSYEPCHVGPPKLDGSWWRVLTKRGPLEMGMADHFIILASGTPWTVWRGKKNF